jgi:hypothetical protein
MREKGAGFCHPLSPAGNGTIGVLEKKFSEIFGKLGICLARMLPRCSRRSAMRQTRNSPKALAPNLATGHSPVWTANSGRHGKRRQRRRNARFSDDGHPADGRRDRD